MKAEVAFTSLLAAARALKPYTTPQRWHTRTWLLYLRTDGDILTLSATTGDETAHVAVPGAVADGACAVAPDTLIRALTAIKPGGRAARAAVVRMRAADGRLHLDLDTGWGVGLDTDDPAADPPTVVPAHGRLVTVGPVAGWCDLVAGVASAAGRDLARPDLSVVRLRRDHPQLVLMVEATDRRRVHRGAWGEPAGEPVDVCMPVDAARRAVRLLRAIDPTGQVLVHTDDATVTWHTSQVTVSAVTGTNALPDLEKLREDVLADVTTTFSADRDALAAALRTAHDLAATTTHSRVRLEPHTGVSLDVVVHADSGETLHRAEVAITRPADPGGPLLLDAAVAAQAFAFLDGDHATVHAGAGRLPIYLHGARRHAVLMQLVG
ncbi:hypothetical protein [Micromonospora aurantiaca (nom. illeg.)]|uniref:hypothetical protein n=1 Tax=Micromonospora aurantiaca (nom. illeg.) TaxID=47850 RepID=UPI0033C1304D